MKLTRAQFDFFSCAFFILVGHDDEPRLEALAPSATHRRRSPRGQCLHVYLARDQKEVEKQLRGAAFAHHRFSIDIWEPFYAFAYFEKAEPLREYRYTLLAGEEQITERGPALPFESAPLKHITSDHGYDAFYYPVSVLLFFGFTWPGLKQLAISER